MPRQRDPQTGNLMMEGVRAVVSERTSVVTYRARYVYSARTGKRAFASKTFKAYDAAEDWILKQRLDIRRGQHIDPSSLTVAEYHARWFARMQPQWSGSRQKTVTVAWEKYFASYFGEMKMQRVTRDTCQQLIDALSGAKLNPKTTRLYMIGLVSMLDAAVLDGVIPANPAIRLSYPRARSEPRSVWSPLQLRKMLRETKDDEFGPLWVFLTATGCRIGEALAVQWNDVNLIEGTVWIHRTMSRDANGLYAPRTGTKTNDMGRTIPLERWAVNILSAHRTGAKGPLVFHRHGKPLTMGTVRYQWVSTVARLHLPEIGLHDIRHSVATAMIAAGTRESIVQVILGHKSIATTIGTYTHVNSDMQRQGTSALGVLLGMTTDESETTTSRSSAAE